MTTDREAWILTIGNEIINGVITDTNRELISRELRSAGIGVRGMSSVGDNPAHIAEALRDSMEKADITIVSGGLGPTEDDKTAASVADFLGVSLELDEEQLARIEDRFRKWGRPMSASNRKQAFFPRGSQVLPNDYGTAPGFMIERDGRIALFFPGVPRELAPMIREQGIPTIRTSQGVPTEVFRTRTLIVYGYSESKLGETLADVAVDELNYHLAFLPRFPIIRLRMDVRAVNQADADALLDEREAVIMSRIGESVISSDGRFLEKVVLDLLQERNLTLALAESITGGMIGEMITRVPGASSTFMSSVVSYSNDVKERVLGVSGETLRAFGAVSHQCAQKMAEGARRVGNADIGLSVTGIAGPDGGSPEKPVGTFFVGLSTAERTISRGYLMPGIREWVKTLAATQALDLLRRSFLGLRLHGSEESR